KGKTGGRGGKGQTPRTGGRIKGFGGGQMALHRRLPKRGFNKIFSLHLHVIKLDRLPTAIHRGALYVNDTPDVEAPVPGGVLRRAKDGVRRLARGEIKAAVQFAVHGASKAAIAAVEKAGGSVTVLAPAKTAETAA